MKNIILNLGLENNPLRDKVVINPEATVTIGSEKLNKMSFETSTYNGQKELTFVAGFKTGYAVSKVILEIELMCLEMKQECIAVLIDGIGYLVYNPTFQGDKFAFDKRFFKEI